MRQIYVVLNSSTTESDDFHSFSSKLLSAWTNKGNAREDAEQSEMHWETFDAHASQGRFYFDANLTQEIPVINS